MYRRKFIALTGGIVALSGCAGGEGSDGEPNTTTKKEGTTTAKTTTTTTTTEEAQTQTQEPTTETDDQQGDLSNEEILMAFRMTLEDHDYEIEKLNINEETNTIILDHRSTATSQEDIAAEIGGVAGAFAEGVNQGWDVYYIDIIIQDASGEDIANYYIETGWAEQYNNGEISQEEYFTKILETLVVFD